jgi:hypothetical protein
MHFVFTQNNILCKNKVHSVDVGHDYVDWINAAQDTDQKRTLMTMVMNLVLP